MVLKQFSAAKVYYAQALKLDSKSLLANLGLARLYLDSQNFPKVIETIDQYLAPLAPNPAPALDYRAFGLRGKAYWLMDDTKKASEDFRKALQLANSSELKKYYEILVKTL